MQIQMREDPLRLLDVFSTPLGLHRGKFCPLPWEHVATPGDDFSSLLAPSAQRPPGVPLNVLQRTGQSLPQKITQPRVSAALKTGSSSRGTKQVTGFSCHHSEAPRHTPEKGMASLSRELRKGAVPAAPPSWLPRSQENAWEPRVLTA